MTPLEEIKYRAAQFSIGATSTQTILILEHFEKAEAQNELLRIEVERWKNLYNRANDALELMTSNRNAYKKSKDAFKHSYEKWKAKATDIEQENNELRETLERLKKMMQRGQQTGVESETVFWVRAIWEIDEALKDKGIESNFG